MSMRDIRREESELLKAKKTVRDLTSRIEESNSKAKLQMQELDNIKHRKRGQKGDNHKYEEVMRDLENVKRELSKLKLEIGSASREKIRAENAKKASSSRISNFSNSVHELEQEIEEVNEEQVIVELARIEASKELADIEFQRKEEEEKFSSEIENTKRKINDIIRDINQSKELETKLAHTSADIEMLEYQLKIVKEMDKKVHIFRTEKEIKSPIVSIKVIEELELAKKELASIREEGFQLMASMDVIRDELTNVSRQTAKLKKKDEKTDKIVENLNSKLLRAKARLEAISSSEEKAKTIVDNIFLTSEHLRTETVIAKNERELICKETANMKAQTERIDSEIEVAEIRLEAAIEELEAVKSSESIALEELKNLTECTMLERDSKSKHSSTITISKFEYEYLKGRAIEAEEIADKKIDAAYAWIEALKASEKEIRMKMETAQRNTRDVRAEEDDTYRRGKSISEVGQELQGKSIKSGSTTPVRRVKLRIPPSPKNRQSKSASFNARRKKNIILESR